MRPRADGPRRPVGKLSARRIPFMFLTGYPDAAIPVEYRWARLIAKPFGLSEVKEAMADMLDLRQAGQAAEHVGPSFRH